MHTPLKKNHCQDWKLYVITEPSVLRNKSLEDAVFGAIKGGASVIQLRDKQASQTDALNLARKLLVITRAQGVPLIINDWVEVAKASGADGVHLGQDDASYEAARMVLGDGAIIGRSTHSPEQALQAEHEGFDYIGIGPVFATPTKPSAQAVGLELVKFAAQNIRIPFVAIGGIDQNNVSEVVRCGAKTVAVVRAVMGAEDCAQSARQILKQIKGE